MIVDAQAEVRAGRGVRDPEDLDPLALASSAFRIRWNGRMVCCLSTRHVCDDRYDCRSCSVPRGREHDIDRSS